jgi:hypothetical protein
LRRSSPARRASGTGRPIPDAVDFGCEYCADEQNRFYGHVTQIGSSEARGRILLRCPRCDALYENTPAGPDETRRLTEVEADRLFPGHA